MSATAVPAAALRPVEHEPIDREGSMDMIALATNDSSAGGWMTLVIPVGFLVVVLICAWAMRHRVP